MFEHTRSVRPTASLTSNVVSLFPEHSRDTTAEHPDGIQFAMYDAEKYAKPEGKFDTVTAVDNSKWYKQYAAPAVERTPYMDPKGKVQYNEKIVQKIPKAPMRKDKM